MSATPPPPPPPSSSPPPDEAATTFADGFDLAPAAAGGPGVGPESRTIPPAWKRIVARFLDGLIINMIVGFVIIRSIAGDGVGTVTAAEDVDTGRLFLATALVLLVGFVWDAVATKIIGGTPMKRAFGMRVVQAGSGAPVGWRHAIIRWGTVAIWSVVPVLSLFVPLILVVVSLVFLYTKPLRQAVWDLTAKTVVVDG
jgi:RDD family